MTDERIITAATITTGEKGDGPFLKELIEKSIQNGVDVQNVLGDRAYSGKENIKMAEAKGIKLYSRLNPSISNEELKEGWQYNKDADRIVCPAGHMAFKKARQGRKNGQSNQADCHYFDIEKCKVCPIKDGCYKPGAATKTYSKRILCDIHSKQKQFEETQEFKEKIKNRYMIEAKNDELKNRHGLKKSYGTGLLSMDIQGATTIFVVNIKRIMKLMA